VVLLSPTNSVQALCGCMFGRRPLPRVPGAGSMERGLSSDPKYSPSAAVFVVRDGLRTILTMEAAYKGPREPISMVLPVPTSIGRSDVSTLPGSLFRNLDRRTAPRVQHVFPACPVRRPRPARAPTSSGSFGSGAGMAESAAPAPAPPPVEVVDEWSVDEYDISVLDANQSTGLLTYLREHHLALPADAEPVLRRYIETNHRFVLATVDPSRAHTLDDDTMVLSPLQIRYESPNLTVPVRLGTLNSPGEQELLLYVLASDGRYEIANRPSVSAPTDLRLERNAAGNLAGLYKGLMDELFHQTPAAAVTEFAHTLGSRIGFNNIRRFGLTDDDRRGKRWTLTRIRHRFGKNLNDDLVLRRTETPLRLQSRVGPMRNVGVWAPQGESAFHVRFLVRHRECASTERRRQLARQFAVAESMLAEDQTPWPGTLLRDPVPALGIMPGSTAPSQWPRPRVEATPAPVEPPAEWAAVEANEVEGAVTANEASAARTEAPAGAGAPTAPVNASAPRAPSVDSGACRAGGAANGAWFVLLLALVAIRRRRFGEADL
ncbi:MAG: DUF2330 domain-containing protein, partial [Myxococcota bacterium]